MMPVDGDCGMDEGPFGESRLGVGDNFERA